VTLITAESQIYLKFIYSYNDFLGEAKYKVDTICRESVPYVAVYCIANGKTAIPV